MVRKIAFYLFVVIVGAIGLEAAYRAYLLLRIPQQFEPPRADAPFFVYDRPQWEYDQEFGYHYISNARMNGTMISDGEVAGCSVEGDVNSAGNVGPEISDYPDADLRILVFGDSFTASALDGRTWPAILQEELERATGRSVRVLNLARDGYGVVQMFDLAAARIPELRPSLVVFAFNHTALSRGRSWRLLTGEGDGTRFLTMADPGLPPDPATSTDMIQVHPGATGEWCASRPPPDDPTLRAVIRMRRAILDRGAALPTASVFDLSTSYVFNRLLYQDPFADLWRRMPPAINPVVSFDDYREDQRFVEDLRRIIATGVPFLTIHLPKGSDLQRGREWALYGNYRSLLASLERITGRPLLPLRERLAVAPEEAMRLCRAPDNCHPSEFGMRAYAHAIAGIIQAERQ